MADKVSSIAKDLASEMPEPQEHAIEAESKGGEKPDIIASGPKDKQGRGFNPAIHETDAEGNPRTNVDGTIKIKRGQGSPTKSTLASPRKIASASANPGAAIAESIFAICQMIGGAEWKPNLDPAQGINERQSMIDAWEAYAEAKGIDDIPPGLAVTMAMLGYAVPRFFMPATKTRIEKVKGWVVEKYLTFKNR